MLSDWRKQWLVVLLSCFAVAVGLANQPENDIKIYIDKLNNGKVEEVKEVLSQLITQYQDTPELIYLQGRLTANGMEAVKYYQMVLDNFPKSEWADKSLYHIYQYHYAMGMYENAGKEMQRLKKEFPSSPVLAEAANIQLPRENNIHGKNADGDVLKGSNKDKVAANDARSSEMKEDTKAGAAQHTAAGEMYALQVGAFSTSANADKQKGFFEKLGFPVEITSKVMMNKGLYLVWVGDYKTSQEAKRSGDQIRKKYKINSMVVAK
jgi:tetratricopeptide (TPR) repeat protein